MRDQRSYLQIKLDAIHRYQAWHYSSAKNRHILVTEFPKSGGTWFCQMLSDITGLSFPRNENFKGKSCVLHGHYLYHKNFYRPIHVLRDGRDVMVSAYHYFLLNNDVSSSLLVKWRGKMRTKDFNNVKDNLSHFIEVFFCHFKVVGRKVKWNDFVNQYCQNPAALTIKYEELSIEPMTYLMKSTQWLNMNIEETIVNKTIEKFNFKKQSGREKGSESSDHFLRKGIVGDWKNHFTRESAEVFNFYAGDALIKAGYEKDKKWY